MTPKEEELEILRELSDDVSWEQIQYHLYVRQKIEGARAEGEAGKVLTQAQVEERMGKWLGEE